MAKREQAGYQASNLAKKVANDIQWVAENLEMGDNDCYRCNEKNDSFQIMGAVVAGPVRDEYYLDEGMVKAMTNWNHAKPYIPALSF